MCARRIIIENMEAMLQKNFNLTVSFVKYYGKYYFKSGFDETASKLCKIVFQK